MHITRKQFVEAVTVSLHERLSTEEKDALVEVAHHAVAFGNNYNCLPYPCPVGQVDEDFFIDPNDPTNISENGIAFASRFDRWVFGNVEPEWANRWVSGEPIHIGG